MPIPEAPPAANSGSGSGSAAAATGSTSGLDSGAGTGSGAQSGARSGAQGVNGASALTSTAFAQSTLAVFIRANGRGVGAFFSFDAVFVAEADWGAGTSPPAAPATGGWSAIVRWCQWSERLKGADAHNSSTAWKISFSYSVAVWA
eukprot:SAG11_NODE_13351_length_659_cov_0.733929_2_plen_145_part_01